MFFLYHLEPAIPISFLIRIETKVGTYIRPSSLSSRIPDIEIIQLDIRQFNLKILQQKSIQTNRQNHDFLNSGITAIGSKIINI